MRTTWGGVVGGLVSLGIVTTSATPARASNELETALFLAVGGLVVTDVVFAAYGISVAGKEQLPSRGWSIAELVLTVPQTVIGNTIYAGVQSKDSDDDFHALILVPTVGVSILSTHGIWSTATDNVGPRVLAWSSVAVGANVALSTGVIASTLEGRLSGRAVGITTMILTAPQIAAAGYLSATNPSSNRAGWIGLTAWSGALFVHGLASAIRGHHDSTSPPEAPPPPPDPPPLPLQRPLETPAPPPPPPNDRPPLLVPESLRVGPTIVTDGIATAPGIGISGLLF